MTGEDSSQKSREIGTTPPQPRAGELEEEEHCPQAWPRPDSPPSAPATTVGMVSITSLPP